MITRRFAPKFGAKMIIIRVDNGHEDDDSYPDPDASGHSQKQIRNHARPIVPLIPNGAPVPQQVPDTAFSEDSKPQRYCGRPVGKFSAGGGSAADHVPGCQVRRHKSRGRAINELTYR
jgi:hypothetical protein